MTTAARRHRSGPTRLTRLLGVLGLLVVTLAACGGGPSPSPGGTPGPTPGPTTGTDFTPGELRLLLVDRLGPLWYCDRDEYPVGRDEQQAALEQWDDIFMSDVFVAVIDRFGFTLGQDFDDAEKLAVYRLWKVASAIPFEVVPSGDGFRFDYLAQPVGGAAEGVRTIGIIDTTGEIVIESRTAAGEPMCPICLVEGTRIDTPRGPTAVDLLRVGDPVWTVDRDGRRVVGTVLVVGSTKAPSSHQVIRLELADGRTMTASPGHPLADGRTLADLSAGDIVGGAAVVALAWLPYGGDRTWDLLVSGSSGVYFVDGIATASTIRPAAVVPGG